ncbi:MAG TPA: hypothetical protein VKU83_10650 [Puia sp.]|nr:hypothetical protein [Puia sp.]
MKHITKKVVGLALFLGVIALALPGCYEGHYYNTYHHHTHGWYDRRHQPPPPNVRWDVDVDVRN